MGKEARMKEIRKQLRNVVKEFLPEVLTGQLTDSIRSELGERLGKRMDMIADNAKQTLADIDSRNKDFQNYVVRQLSGYTPALDVPAQELPETPAETTSE